MAPNLLGRFAAALCSALALIAATTAAADASTIKPLCPPAKPGHTTCLAEGLVTSNDQVRSIVTPAAMVPAGYGPADIQSAYNLPAGGIGRKVAVVDAFDLPTAESDLATYRSQFGLPPCTTANGCFRKINQTGGATPPSPNAAWGDQIASDIDMVSATCPTCGILLVEANSDTVDDLARAADEAAFFDPAAISNSYGSREEDGEASLLDSFTSIRGSRSRRQAARKASARARTIRPRRRS
jgi:subtilase family serine protease